MNQKCEKILPIIELGGDIMVEPDMWHEIHSRFKLKESKKSIGRSVGISVQTVRKILNQTKPIQYQRKKKKETVIAPYAHYIRQRLSAVGYCAQSIFEELQENGYKGSYDQVKRFVRPFREEAQKEATFLECHKEAFDHFDGLTHDIVYDNAKTVVLYRDFEGKRIQWHPSFWDFSRHYGFRARLCRPYRAQTKGKVESGIKYVKRFLRGKT